MLKIIQTKGNKRRCEGVGKNEEVKVRRGEGEKMRKHDCGTSGRGEGEKGGMCEN